MFDTKIVELRSNDGHQTPLFGPEIEPAVEHAPSLHHHSKSALRKKKCKGQRDEDGRKKVGMILDFAKYTGTQGVQFNTSMHCRMLDRWKLKLSLSRGNDLPDHGVSNVSQFGKASSPIP